MDYPVKDDDIRIVVDARGLFTSADLVVPARSSGRFRNQYRMHQPDGQPPLFNWGDFKVDCVSVRPDVTVTGRIVAAGPYWQEFLHRKQLG
jgi:hypothetical protein